MAQVLGFINHAENFYGTDQLDTGQYSAPSTWLTNIPRMKFMWTVEFELNFPEDPDIQRMLQGDDLVGSITNIAKSVQLPDLQFNTLTLNQYNKKRHVHTGGDWQPIQMVFHDTVSNRFEKVLNDYKKYYWVSENNPGLQNLRQRDQTSDNFGGNVGMKAIPYANDNYFKSITINREWMGRTDQYVLINPKITSFVHDTMDYSSNDTAQWTITVAYEGVEFIPGNADSPNRKEPTPSLTYTSYYTQGGAADGTGLSSAGMTGGNGTPEGDETGGFSGQSLTESLGLEGTAVGDAIDGIADGISDATDLISEKYNSLKENVAEAYKDAQNFSIGGIPVGKAINPQNIGTTLAVGAQIYSTGGKALKNPAFLLGVGTKIASGIPGASKYLNYGTAAVAGVAAYQKGGIKGLATTALIAGGYSMFGGKSTQTPMQSFLEDKNNNPGRY
jgi:hypothetical protein